MRAVGTLAFTGDKFVITALEPHATIRLKQLFPRIPRAQAPPFVFDATPEQATELAWFLQRYPLNDAAGHPARAALAGMRAAWVADQDAAERLLSADYAAPVWAGLKDGKALRPHQAAAAELLALKRGLLVGDDVGLGKTFTAIAACLLPGALPAIVVCDRFLQLQWRHRIEEFTSLTAHAVRGTIPYQLPPVDVRIFAWTQLLGWADWFERLGTGLVAFDEVQELRRGRESGKGQAAMRLAASARMRLGLTATPIYNYGAEIFQIMSFLRPEVLGRYDEFMREWAPGGHISDPKALGTYLREQHAMVRQRKPGERVNAIVQHVDHDEAEMASIEDLARRLAETATSGTFHERGEATRELDLRLRMITGLSKAAAVADVVRILVEAGTPMILAGWHRGVYEIWLERLSDLRPAMYTGTETPKKKREEMQRFLDGDTDVFILSLRSGRGIDGLQARAKFVVFGELDWSPEVHHQVIGRLDREGSICDGTDEEITALYLVCDDGSDPPMMEVLGLKASEASGIVDPDLGVRARKSNAEGLKALVTRYLARGSRERAA